MSNTATRLITLIMLLQNKPNQKASELAEKLSVSVRSVHRYIDMLDEMGIPVYSERGPFGGFSLVRGYKMPPLVFSPEEAVAVYLGTGLVREMWGRLYQDAAQGALAKLDSVLPDEQRHEAAWARRTLIATGMHRADQELLAPFLEKVRRAIRERRRARLTYRSRSQPKPLSREVDFLALVHRWGLWYAVGYCNLRSAVRSFRLDRFLEIILLDLTFEVPADFDVHTYLSSEPYAQPNIKIRMRFPPESVLLALDDRPYWEKIEEQPDGAVIVTFATADLEWAARTVLSYSGHAEVLEPDEMRSLVYEVANRIAAQHVSKPDPEI